MIPSHHPCFSLSLPGSQINENTFKKEKKGKQAGDLVSCGVCSGMKSVWIFLLPLSEYLSAAPLGQALRRQACTGQSLATCVAANSQEAGVKPVTGVILLSTLSPLAWTWAVEAGVCLRGETSRPQY